MILDRSQIRTVASAPPEAKVLPSGATATDHGHPSAVTADLTEDPPLTPGEIRERMSGNLCRCGAYVNIVKAISSEALPGNELAEPLSAISLGDSAPYPPAGRLGEQQAGVTR